MTRSREGWRGGKGSRVATAPPNHDRNASGHLRVGYICALSPYPDPMSTTLVLGGTPSAARRYAATLLPAESPVTVVLPGHAPPDRYPDRWTTVQADDLTRTILRGRTPVLVDSLEDWVSGLLDEHDAWAGDERRFEQVQEKIAEFGALWTHAPYDSVALTREVGLTAIPEDPRNRRLRDVLEEVNAAVSGASTRTYLLVAGRALDLSNAAPIG